MSVFKQRQPIVACGPIIHAIPFHPSRKMIDSCRSATQAGVSPNTRPLTRELLVSAVSLNVTVSLSVAVYLNMTMSLNVAVSLSMTISLNVAVFLNVRVSLNAQLWQERVVSTVLGKCSL